MEKLLLIDGSNLLFQMFFGMPARIVNAQGKAIHGTLGFVGAMQKILRRVKPSHVLVVFDGEHENEHCHLEPDYKANRPDYSKVSEDENPFSQLQDIYLVLDYLGIKHLETVDCEADDLIAGYAVSFGKEMEVVISSFDSDFFQLITDTVSVLRYRGEKTVICTPDYLWDKFGIAPEQYVDFKSLVGDAADNIKGAPKVGSKTAALLLAEFGTLENILAHAADIRKTSVRDSLISNARKLQKNKKIIRLSGYTSLPYAIQELKYNDSGITTNEVLKGIGLR